MKRSSAAAPGLVLLALLLPAALPPAWGAAIPGLFNTGMDNSLFLLPGGAVDPHWKLVQSPDASFPGPNAIVINEGYPIAPGGPWLANSSVSKWIGPQASQATGNNFGDYTYRTTFDLAGLEPATAVITGRWSSDNAGVAVVLNGIVTGITYDGNFTVLSNPFTIREGFVEGVNVLDFIVNNASSAVNPTGFRAELGGTAQEPPPPGTPPVVVDQPQSRTVGLGGTAVFGVAAFGSRPFAYQWRFQGVDIPGATSALLTISSASPANAGLYDVVVANAFGSATSDAARLDVVTFTSPSSRRTGLVISEIMYHPAERLDGRNLEFVEIYNSNPFPEDVSGHRLSGAVDYEFPDGLILGAGGLVVVAAAPEDVRQVYGLSQVLGPFTNSLPNGAGTVRLRKGSGGIILETAYQDQAPWPVAADGAGHSLVCARPWFGGGDPRAWLASARIGGSPGTVDPATLNPEPSTPLERVVINEVLAHTDLPLLDFVELFNPSPVPVDLDGCWLTDDPGSFKFHIPPGTSLPPGGRLAFEEDVLGFGLGADGDEVLLVNPDKTRVIDGIRFGGRANGVSYGRYPDGAPGFQDLAARTMNAPNAPMLVRNVVINEIMFNPASGSDEDEYVELHNRGGSAAQLGGWRLEGGIGFTFPAGTIIPGGGYLVVAANAARLATNYPGLAASVLMGNFNGQLSNGGERLALAMPDTLVTTNQDTGFVTTNAFTIVMDEVNYGDGGPWGPWADGGGSSLELKDAHSDNRLPSNWGNSDETSKAPWTTVEASGVLDLAHQSQALADQLQVFLMGNGEALVDDVEVLVASANRIPNPGFESGLSGWVTQGTQRRSFQETSGGFNSARCLHIVATERGDHVANRIRAPLSAGIAAGTQVTIRAKVRWLRGHPEILFRLKGGHLEAAGRLPVSASPGTPGAANSTAQSNAGPAISDVAHFPVLPAAGQAIRVTARLQDPDGFGPVQVRYRIDPSTTLATAGMADNGLNGDERAGDGVYTGFIPGQLAGTLVAFRLVAADDAGVSVSTQFPADAPERECLVRVGESMPAGSFGTYRLWITQASHSFWTSREKMSNEDVDATFVYGTNHVVYNAGAHFSGSSYTSPGYDSPTGALCGYDINLPEDQALLGETHFTLDWPVRDGTDQREQLMFWFLEQYRLPNMYRRYVNMFVNGVKRGTIYDDVQQPGADAINEYFDGDNEGTLLKTDCWNEFQDTGTRQDPCVLNSLEVFLSGGVKKTARYRWNWRPRAVRGSANDFNDLFSLVDVMNLPGGSYQAAVEGLVDVEHWMYTFAMNDLASYWDGFGNPNAKNTYLYKPEGEGWKLFCWDFDVGLGVFNDPVNDPLFPGLNDPTMTRLYNTPGFVRIYWRALEEALNGFFQVGPGTKINAILDGKFAAFQASGISLGDPAAIKDWITQRRAFLQGQLAAVASGFTVNESTLDVSGLNLATITGTAPVAVKTILVNNRTYPVTWLSVTRWSMTVPLQPGENVLNVEGLDSSGRLVPGAMGTVTVQFNGAGASPDDMVVITEIAHHPVLPEAEFVEIHNRSPIVSFDLSGWRFNGLDYTFPPGSILTNGQYLVLAKNRGAFVQAFGAAMPVFDVFDGTLDNGGETLSLLRPGSVPGEEIMVDRVSYDDDPPWPQVSGTDLSLQVIDEAQDNTRVGNWTAGIVDNGWRSFSITQSLAGPANSVLFALASAGTVYLDNIELVLGAVPGAGPNLLQNGGLEAGVLSPWTAQGNHVGSAASSDTAFQGAYSMKIVATGPGSTIDLVRQSVPGLVSGNTYTFSFKYFSTGPNRVRWRINGFFADFNTGLDVTPLPPVKATPGAPNALAQTLPPFDLVWLNEAAPENTGVPLDLSGEAEPWVELYHGGGQPLAMTDYFLADNYTNLAQWALPSAPALDPVSFKLVWADGEPGETTGGDWHAAFRLNPGSGTLALSRLVNGTPQIVDYLNYNAVAPGQSFGSYPEGNPFFRRLLYYPTAGAANDPSFPPTPVFINEWMASNTGRVTDPYDQDADDWFELYNPGDERVFLAGYRLTDDPDNPTKHVIPAGFFIEPHGFFIVWADEESGQTAPSGELHVNFRLSAGGEDLWLYAPNGQLVDAVSFGAQAVNVTQGRFPDGAAGPFPVLSEPTPRAANLIGAMAVPEILSVAVDLVEGTAVLVWTAEAGGVYRVEFQNVLDVTPWERLPDDVQAGGTTASATDRDIDDHTQRFYRVVRIR